LNLLGTFTIVEWRFNVPAPRFKNLCRPVFFLLQLSLRPALLIVNGLRLEANQLKGTISVVAAGHRILSSNFIVKRRPGLPTHSFSLQKSQFGILWRASERKMLVHFTAIWYISRPFGIFCGHLVYSVVHWIFCGHLVYVFCGIFCGWYIFLNLACCTNKNLSTLI
jgi:hypothetical protein